MREWTKLLLIVAACGLAAGGCGPKAVTPGPIDEYAGVVHKDVLAKAGLQYYWTLQTALEPDERIVQLYRADENLYCLTNTNRLLAVNAQVGVPRWDMEVGGPSDTVYRPWHAEKKIDLPVKPLTIAQINDPKLDTLKMKFDGVYINTTRNVLLADRKTGKVLRDIPFDFAAHSGGAGDGTMYFCGSAEGQYHAFDIPPAVPAWTHLTDDMISAPLIQQGSIVYVGSRDGTLTAFTADRVGEVAWKVKLPQAITAPFYVDKRACFVPCEDGRLYAYSPLNGREMWDPFVCEGPLRYPVQVSKSTIFQYATGDAFYAIHLAKGKERWRLKDGRTVLAVMKGKAYVLDKTRTLRIVDETLGTLEMSIPMTGFDLLMPNTSVSAIYGCTPTGRLFCIRPIDAGYLTAEQLNPDAMPEDSAGAKPKKAAP